MLSFDGNKINEVYKNSRLQESDNASSVLRTQNIIPSGDLALEFCSPLIFYSEIRVAEENNQKLRIDKQSPINSLRTEI